MTEYMEQHIVATLEKILKQLIEINNRENRRERKENENSR